MKPTLESLGKENYRSLGKNGGGRMPKRKRPPSSSQDTFQPPFVSIPDAEEVEIIEPRTTDVLFGRGDNINR